MVGAARRLATELVVIRAKAIQEIQTAVGTFGRAMVWSALLTAATSQRAAAGSAVWARAVQHRPGRGAENLCIPLPSIT